MKNSHVSIIEERISDKWPRRLIAADSHYLVHKVASVTIKDDRLSFLFIDGSGRTYSGPGYCSLVNGQKPVAAKQLQANGLCDVSEVRFVVAHHSGAFPNGHPCLLLRDFPCPRADEYAAVIQRDNEKWAPTPLAGAKIQFSFGNQMDFAKLFGAVELDGVLPILAKSQRARHALEKALGRKRGKKAVEMLRSGTLEGKLGDEIYDHFLEELENEAEWVWGAVTYHPEDPDNYDYIFPIEIREYEGVFYVSGPESERAGYFLSEKAAHEYVLMSRHIR
jgi:hypothetical protein